MGSERACTGPCGGVRMALSDSVLCSICETPALPGFEVSGRVGDDKDWFETPVPLADICVAEVVKVIEERTRVVGEWPHNVDEWTANPIRRVLCPAVGRGMFPAALRRYYEEMDAPQPHIAGCDIVDRTSESDPFASCDKLDTRIDAREWVPGVGPWDLAIDNIPFDAEVAIPIVQRFVEIASWCAFILPWSPLGGVDQWKPIMDSDACRPLYAWPIAPRPWGDNVRETALYVWRRGEEQPAYTKVRGLPRWKP